MILTALEKQHAALFADVRAKGAEVGAMVREMGWVKADQTIARAATGYVNRLPINDINLERKLYAVYIIAAESAATEQR